MKNRLMLNLYIRALITRPFEITTHQMESFFVWGSFFHSKTKTEYWLLCGDSERAREKKTIAVVFTMSVPPATTHFIICTQKQRFGVWAMVAFVTSFVKNHYIKWAPMISCTLMWRRRQMMCFFLATAFV